MEQKFPKIADLFWPTLKVLEKRGGSATIQEISEGIADELDLSDEILNVQHGSSSQSEVDFLAAWVRTELRLAGLVENTSRGVWTITEAGRSVPAREDVRKWIRDGKPPKPPKSVQGKVDEAWKDSLLAVVRDIKPDAFERLCQRVLRQAGFVKVEVTGRSGDGGIDGAGVLRVNLLSFHVRFQCKRYAGAVSTREIRDFRGAMVGRSDKGLFLTTGVFTKDAQREAVRDGAPAIDLIDGADLCDLLKEHGLGVRTETVEVVEPTFFETL